MDALKALLEKKRSAVPAGKFGDQKFVKQSELEELRLKRLREEEEAERREKEQRKRSRSEQDSRTLQRHESGAKEEELPKEEVIRRLRLLQQPVTLFGEDDVARAARLRKAQEDFQAEDEHTGGQQANTLLLLQKEGRLKAKQALTSTEPTVKKDGKDPPASRDHDEQDNEPEQAEEESETARMFREAAEALKEKREEEAMSVEERISKYFKRWCKEWGEDLDRRPEAVKKTGGGNQATLQYQQTMTFIKPLYKLLKQKQVHPEMVAGLYMIVQAIKQRNYLHAYDVYMRLAIGNNPWPIGVTSVGIHERSAREKISHVMNGGAHIMNDEATRKYLQAVKRLLTFVQRAYPTDPSRSVDFDGFRDAGRGAAGSGSDKQALLEAERKGMVPLLEAPKHFHDKDGTIKVPPKWENILKQSEVYKEISNGTPRTPPRSPLQSNPPKT
ncbi:Pre-mRNA-splicing factor 18 [Coccomyxa sp. Obi]|nr:Pre-mRNA-splicing factor 18 [Coccomyxa sp. Obi]